MFSVDLPKDGAGDDVLPDIVRVVASNDGDCRPDHPVLLARRLPVGTAVDATAETTLWKVSVGDPDERGNRPVTVRTLDDRPLVALRLTGGGPCVLDVQVASGVQAWGLGQCFGPSSARVDWVGRRRSVVDASVQDRFRPYGHGTQDYEKGVEGYLQIPVLMVAGDPQPFAIVLDYVFRIEADFGTNPWSFQLGSDVPGNPTFPVRVYLVGGATSLDVRRRVMDLLGRPPVPPRKAFGLWMSEYGFETWQDVDHVIGALRGGAYPFDGIVLDLFWFGGIAQQGVDHSEVGRLGWDITDTPGVDDPYFPDPQGRLASYRNQHIGFALIEESYVNTSTSTYIELGGAVQDPFVRLGPSDLQFTNVWFGQEATMIDWSVPGAGAWIHDHRRKPFMVDYGVRVHWTDLGEPEFFDDRARYAGHDLDGDGSRRTGHADVANVYNSFWHRSIDDGYSRNDPDQRRLLLTRAGTAGIQRYGAAVWSGDTSSRMPVLVSQLHNQAHMSCSGIDYYGSDVGGFHRQDADSQRLDELYTQWFANSAWLDVPLRPHVNNYDFYTQRSDDKPDGPRRHPVAPYEVGHRPSNLANLRTRYELIPYYYSLAHQASLDGTPMMPPPGLVYPDAALLGIGHQKLIGTDLMVAVVAGHGEYARSVYLPAGRWYDFWSGAAVESAGQWVTFVPEYRDGVFRLPVFARGGAVIPRMHVDDGTQDSAGHQADGSRDEDLILRVYDGGEVGGRFTVYEDDGETRSSAPRTTDIVQRHEGEDIVVEVAAAKGLVPDSADVRPLRIEVVSSLVVSGVTLNGAPLPPLPSPSRTQPGWAADPDSRTVHACVPDAGVAAAYTFRFATAGTLPATSSVLLVCDSAYTTWGEDVHARFVTPVQTAHGSLTEVQLEPSVTHAYLYPAPADHPSGPVWTLLLDHLQPNQEVRFALEKRRGDVVVHTGPRQVFRYVGPGGYAGEIRGNLY
ncbi:alpha-glucosidase [Geodermatophilus pulveris]|uniref:Alpha-glucosidase n=1 Tax=Geodermatophilus pulveris TaxID=1564159 RepID=A0A239DU25_9ACTN|nr:TIM-barrel domain-containing protein [Geodermatophilus pulveris]SNS35857.1 alpha-glucosidase [Geodermatophilus pulveris]